jgi:hypothetical protein
MYLVPYRVIRRGRVQSFVFSTSLLGKLDIDMSYLPTAMPTISNEIVLSVYLLKEDELRLTWFPEVPLA